MSTNGGGDPPGSIPRPLSTSAAAPRTANGSAPSHNKRALDYISSGQVPVKDLITVHLPLERAMEAFDIVAKGEAIKVTIEP